MNKKMTKKTIFPIIILAALAVILIVLLVRCNPFGGTLSGNDPTSPTEPSAPTESGPDDTEPEITEPQNTEPQMLAHMAEKQNQNPDFAAWVKIDGTALDYPVMYTPDDREKYLHLDFNQQYSFGGVPFFDSYCSLDPESDNLIIYGHNMNNGTMFRTLMSYTDRKFWEEHPQVQFTTLYEERTYDIVAVFYDRVYYKYEDVFKFYQFIDAKDEEHFQEAMTYYKDHALYDTGVTAQYGDRLLTLVTCAYHEENGRFVLVARQRAETPVQQPVS